MMDNGWIRVSSAHVADEYRHRIWADNGGGRIFSGWLAQANHILDRLDIACDLQNYFLIDVVDYWLNFSGPTPELPPAYLFLCPLDDLQSDPACFRAPDCPAYWSLDCAGAGRLTADEVRTAGFPDIELRMEILGKSWDGSVYTGIRQLHEAEGFEPSGQEAAIAMGCPLFEITCDPGDLLAHSI
ncbi:hypothetical protein C8R47DRAFT_661245 [Mycena vitilis]|nr:hypothetical protein C8R47DRAFT_661245 [Mycena vitilis]